MEDAVHPFEGADQGVFIPDVGLQQRRKGGVRGARGLVSSQGCPTLPGPSIGGAREVMGLRRVPVTSLSAPFVELSHRREHARHFTHTISSRPREIPVGQILACPLSADEDVRSLRPRWSS